jgi:hypothetical protein
LAEILYSRSGDRNLGFGDFFFSLPFILAKAFGFEEFWVRGLVQNFAEQELVRNSHLLLQ